MSYKKCPIKMPYMHYKKWTIKCPIKMSYKNAF